MKRLFCVERVKLANVPAERTSYVNTILYWAEEIFDAYREGEGLSNGGVAALRRVLHDPEADKGRREKIEAPSHPGRERAFINSF
jgi:hypothetical protein